MRDDYDRLWARVDSLEEQGLPRSAWEIVEEIATLARADQNEPHLLKALLYRSKYVAALEDGEINRIVSDLTAESTEVSSAAAAVLHSILGDILWRYYQANRYVFLDRTAAPDLDEEDIQTWTPRRIIGEAVRHFELSLSERAILQSTSVESVLVLLEQNGRDRRLRPTLYDFLAHRALEVYSNSESGLSEPQRPFRFDDPRFMGTAEGFADLKIETTDSLSTEYRAIALYQDLVRFHLADADSDALIDVDLARLAFVRRSSDVADRDSAYVARLRDMQDRYGDTSAGAAVTHALAAAIAADGYRYDPFTSERLKWRLKEAHDLCASAVAKYPSSFGGEQCRVLQSSIEEKSASFLVEEVVVPGQPFKLRLDYRNMSRVYVAAVRVRRDEMMIYPFLPTREREALIEQLMTRERAFEDSFALEDDGDYQSHSTELPMRSLQPGLYAVLVGSHPEFRSDGEARGLTLFAVSRLGIVERRGPDGATQVRVVDRDTGEPVGYATVTLWDIEYVDRRRQPKKSGAYTTDADGLATLLRMDGGSFFLTVERGQDLLVSMDWRHTGRYTERASHNVTRLFTDRAIYRPGQKLYFKGILLHSDGERYTIRPGARTSVRLLDPNRRELAYVDLEANEFGTVSGSFDVPTGAGTGSMEIRADYGSETFSVEEYKRPRFEVTFDPVEGEVELGGSVRVAGTASAYSGAPVDGASVRYRVTRTSLFRPWQFFRGIRPPTADAEIASGTVATNADGSFEITFVARPDRDIPRSANPIFRYRVVADVTDFAGETQTGTRDVRVGYTSLVLGLRTDEHWDRDTLTEVTVSTENVEGSSVGASGRVTVSRLDGPDRLLRDRPWPRVDRPLLSEDDYRELFPADPYADENDPATWPVAEVVLQADFNTQESTEVPLEGITKWPLGMYRVEAVAVDGKGREVRAQRLVTVFSTRGSRPPVRAIDWFVPLKVLGEPGETARLLVGSAAKDVRAFVEVEKRGRVVEKRIIELSNSQQILEFPIGQDDRGNFAVHISFVRHGRAVVRTHVITVPFTNKQLTLKLETFRDQLYPGQDEEWRLRITGSEGEPVAAELLAAMYDASLDQFVGHDWDLNLYGSRWVRLGWTAASEWGYEGASLSGSGWNRRFSARSRSYDRLNWFGLDRYFSFYSVGYMRSIQEGAVAEMAVAMPAAKAGREDEMGAAAGDAPDAPDEAGAPEGTAAPAQAGPPRTNFSETAFFFPDLRTNENGEVSLVFTIPEALTRWRMLGLAHTTDLRIGKLEASTVTQKDLMITANAPRFFREGDRVRFAANVQNLTDSSLTGTARLELFEMETMRPLDAEFGNTDTSTSFSLSAGRSQGLRWTIRVPEGVDAVVYRVTADAGKQSDGEQKPLPVLTNRMLVTESLPLPLRGPGTKSFTFEKLRDNRSSTLRHHGLTLEYSPNPVWYAVQALPYMMEFPHECTEQLFTRLYANSIAGHVVDQNPRIKSVFEQWRDLEAGALQSNLEKNQELKALVIEETPWLLAAQDESERKRRIAVLFDFARMQNERAVAIRKLLLGQRGDGAWPWFEGMPPSRWITQHIVAGFGHLNRLGIFDPSSDAELGQALDRAIAYLDREIKADYDELIERGANLELRHLGWMQIHYLYARSYFTSDAIPDESLQAFDYYMRQARKFWLENDLYAKGMIALALHRWGDAEVPPAIVRSLAENASHSDELGMFWKFNRGYYWYQAPIETQSLLIEVFDEIADDRTAVADMQLWLLKQKQTTDWKTTKATSEAVYALLMRGTNLIDEDSYVTIRVGDEMIDSRTVADAEAGTGYFSTTWEGHEVRPEQSAVEVTKVGPGPAWGALYWQYFEQLDRITPAETPLSVEKQLFREEITDAGPVLKALDRITDLSAGDRITVRIVIRVDRDMEYVHLKDMRAAGFEPINVVSGYRYKGGLHYYESTRDAATHFFIGYLPKGTYVFEYPLKVNLSGDFSNGITSIQSMYAPEFASHSEGTRVEVID